MGVMSKAWRTLAGVYDGDWHSRLMNAINLAEKEAISLELQASIKEFREFLMQNDECLQRVTVTKRMPRGIDYKFACEHVQATCEEGEEVTFHPEDTTQMTMTLVRRGSLSYVSRQADWIVHQGLLAAIREINVTKWVASQEDWISEQIKTSQSTTT